MLSVWLDWAGQVNSMTAIIIDPGFLAGSAEELQGENDRLFDYVRPAAAGMAHRVALRHDALLNDDADPHDRDTETHQDQVLPLANVTRSA